jgi:hypothetical protein
MTQNDHNPDAEQVEISDEPMIDDEKPVGNRFRIVLIVLAVGMFIGGIYWNFHKTRKIKERMQERKSEPSIVGSRYVEPPPAEAYPWIQQHDVANSIATRIPPPPGAVRVQVQSDSFANWLRYLPIKAGQQEVLLYNHQPKQNQRAHCAVIDIDTGPGDLQQGAETVLRLRAEYLFARNDFDAIRFHVAPGETVDWNRWRAGDRPSVKDGKVTWQINAASADNRYVNFRAFLDAVFALADTNSLVKDLAPVPDAKDMQIGDVFVHPGRPGHAVIVVDMVQDLRTGEKGFLLAQSFIPAQDMHVLVNAYNPQGPPWYRTNYGEKLQTPEWSFQASELRRFP